MAGVRKPSVYVSWLIAGTKFFRSPPTAPGAQSLLLLLVDVWILIYKHKRFQPRPGEKNGWRTGRSRPCQGSMDTTLETLGPTTPTGSFGGGYKWSRQSQHKRHKRMPRIRLHDISENTDALNQKFAKTECLVGLGVEKYHLKRGVEIISKNIWKSFRKIFGNPFRWLLPGWTLEPANVYPHRGKHFPWAPGRRVPPGTTRKILGFRVSSSGDRKFNYYNHYCYNILRGPRKGQQKKTSGGGRQAPPAAKKKDPSTM